MSVNIVHDQLSRFCVVKLLNVTTVNTVQGYNVYYTLNADQSLSA